MERVKIENQKVRQNGEFLHTSRLALENLSKTHGMRWIPFAFTNTKRGKSVFWVLATRVSTTYTDSILR